MRRLIAAIGASLVATAVLGDATAEAAGCSNLRIELARLQSGASPAMSRKGGRYERAWHEQAAVLARAEQEAGNAGCNRDGFLFLRAPPRSAYRTLVPKIRRMRSNLAKLERLRARHDFVAARQISHRRIRQVQALIVRQGCERPVQEVRAVQGDAGEERMEQASLDVVADGATYRTLCVRACDGYYFPISFSTTRDHFAGDLAACESRCPGAEVDLYYHTGADADSGRMTSIGGQPYSQMPTAFRYRRELDKSCTCGSGGAGRRFAVIGTSTAADPATPEPVSEPAPLPQAKPAPGENPEMIAHREGGFVPGHVSDGIAGVRDGTAKPVRIVGPAYWGGPRRKEALLIRVPN